MIGGGGGLALFRRRMYTDTREEDLGLLIKIGMEHPGISQEAKCRVLAMIYTMLCIPIGINQSKGVSGSVDVALLTLMIWRRLWLWLVE
jgi:hypothetical protein